MTKQELRKNLEENIKSKLMSIASNCSASLDYCPDLDTCDIMYDIDEYIRFLKEVKE